MHPSLKRAIGRFFTPLVGLVVAGITAGAGSDNSNNDSSWVSRHKSSKRFLSGKLSVHYKATLQDGETLSLVSTVRHATDSSGTGAADYATKDHGVVATGGSGGTTEEGVVELDVDDLAGSEEFLQARVHADLSASATDTADIGAVLEIGGADELPA